MGSTERTMACIGVSLGLAVLVSCGSGGGSNEAVGGSGGSVGDDGGVRDAATAGNDGARADVGAWDGPCGYDHADCDGNPANGCETNVSIDPNHCGACGHSCRGAACEFGTCQGQVIATGQVTPGQIALDDASIYWLNGEPWPASDPGPSGAARTVMTVGKSGGTPSTLATSPTTPTTLSIDDTHVYWSYNGSGGPDSTAFVMSVPKDGGEAQQVTSVSNTLRVGAAAVDEGTLFFVAGGHSGCTLFAIPTTGGTPTTLASLSSDPFCNETALGTDTTDVYCLFTTNESTLLVSVPKSGGAVTQLAASGWSMPPRMRLPVRRGHVYWIQDTTFDVPGHAMVVPTSGGSSTVLATSIAPTWLTLDDSHLFITDRIAGAVLRAPIAGGATSQLALAVQPSSAAVDDTYVYWTSAGDGTVQRAAK